MYQIVLPININSLVHNVRVVPILLYVVIVLLIQLQNKLIVLNAKTHISYIINYVSQHAQLDTMGNKHQIIQIVVVLVNNVIVVVILAMDLNQPIVYHVVELII